MKFPDYTWLMTLSHNYNYSFLICGNYDGFYGELFYDTDGTFTFILKAGATTYAKRIYGLTSGEYEQLQQDANAALKSFMKSLLVEHSSEWTEQGNNMIVKADCVIPF